MEERICKNCGGALTLKGNIYLCRFCGAVFENNAVGGTLTTLAFEQLRTAKFDDASETFSEVISKYPNSHEAYFGKLLAKYGVVFVDEASGKKIPTCYELIESVTDDDLFKKAVDLAPSDVAEGYKKLGKKIERVRAAWKEKASKEKPYDIFLCFKDSDRENGIERTKDSFAASDLYAHLTQDGYRVFFSRVSLSDKISEEYEPYIFGAIQSSPIMIVYGEKGEYFDSTWMKNEWTRFAKRIDNGTKRPDSLIVVYDNMNPYDLPPRLRSRQCLDASDMKFYPNLLAHIEKVIKAARAPVPQIQTIEIKGVKRATRASKVNINEIERREVGGIKVEQITPDEAATVKTGFMFLEKGMWNNAEAAFEKVLSDNEYCADAIWGQMLCNANAKTAEEFINKSVKLNDFDSFFDGFERVIKCASKKLANEVLSVFYKCTCNVLKTNLKDKATMYFNAVAPYNTKNRAEFIAECLGVVVKKKDEDLMGLVLSAVDPERVDVYIEAVLAFADDNLKASNFPLARRWYEKASQADTGEVRALRGILKCEVGSNNLYEYDGKIAYLKDYTLFEKVLQHCPSIVAEVKAAVIGLTPSDIESFDAFWKLRDPENFAEYNRLQDEVSKLTPEYKAVMESSGTMSRANEISDRYHAAKNALDGLKEKRNEFLDIYAEHKKARSVNANVNDAVTAFDALIRYVPKSETATLIECLYRMAFTMLHSKNFAEAERYFAQIVTEAKNEYRAYWGLLQSRLHCRSDEELTHCRTDITTFPEFNSAVTAATFCEDERFAKCCIDISSKRANQVLFDIEKETKQAKRQEEQRKLAESDAKRARKIKERERKILKKHRIMSVVALALTIISLGGGIAMAALGYETGVYVTVVLSILAVLSLSVFVYAYGKGDRAGVICLIVLSVLGVIVCAISFGIVMYSI